MRFGMVTTFYPPFSYGGDATYVRNLSRALVEQGHDVDVIASTEAYLVRSKDGDQVVPSWEDGVSVRRIRHAAGLLAPLVSQQTGLPAFHTAALNAFFAHPFDVLHFHNVSLMGGPGVLRMGQARARLMSLHDHWLICPTHALWKNRSHACDRRTCFTCTIRSGLPPQLWRYTRLRDRSLESVDRLLAPSKFTADMHRANGIEARIEVLPLFSSLEGAAAAEAEQPRRVVFAGRITALKGIETLLRVVSKMPDIELFVLGQGELRGLLTAAYAQHPNIRFFGKVEQDQLAEHFARAAAVVFPSLVPETFGLTIVEAAACGTPAIVAKSSGGAAELVSTTGGGLLYQGDEELATAIRQLVEDRPLRNELGARARAGYQQRYTKELHIAAYLSQIDDILQDKR
jgi:glycosyltransferase involved in cell wall biosynthesis